MEPIHLEPEQFLMTTLRSHDQYNTTIYGLDDRYRGIFHGRRVVFMNPDDMKEHGWKAGDRLDITSHFRNNGKEELRMAPRFVASALRDSPPLRRDLFSRGECAGADRQRRLGSNTPTSKAVVVSLVPPVSDDGAGTTANDTSQRASAENGEIKPPLECPTLPPVAIVASMQPSAANSCS